MINVKKDSLIKEFINIQDSLTFVLDHPFDVIYKKVNSPVSFVGFFTKIGSVYEEDDYKGIAHLIEHCIFRGSKNYPKDISKTINNLGGYTNAYTSYDQTVYYINLPSDSLFRAMDILWDMVFNPLFREEDIESERNIIFHEIEMRDDEPMVVLFEETLKNFYSKNPLRHPIIGYSETLKNITKNEIEKFFSYYKNRKFSFFVIVSDIDKDVIQDKLYSLQSSLPVFSTINEPVVNFQLEVPNLSGSIKLKGPVSKTYLMLSYKAPTLLEKYKDIEKSYYLSLMSYLLSGSSYSILNRKLKNELKIVDAVNFDFYSTNELNGITYFSSVSDPKNIDYIIEEYRKIVKNLKNYIDYDYFEIAKENFYSTILWNFETSHNQGMLLGTNNLFKNYKEAYYYVYQINKISYHDIFDVFYEYVDPDIFFVSIYDKD